MGSTAGADGQVLANTAGSVTISGRAGEGAPFGKETVVSAAGLQGGAVAPGEIITLFGDFANSVDSLASSPVSIDFDGISAPILYSGESQINAVVPFEVSGRSQTFVGMTRNGVKLASIALDVVPAHPALFTLDGSGVGPAAAINQDGTINGPLHPAAPQSIIALYVTGAGQTDPPGVTGQAADLFTLGRLAAKVKASVAGVPAEVVYAGPAPGLISGLAQINMRMPSVAGPAASVALQVGDAATPEGVWIFTGGK
jgi:uncharacterized protein (TIGR03437 family)